MWQLFISFVSTITLTQLANVTQSPLSNVESGIVVVYESSIIIPTGSQSTYEIKYSKTHPTPPTPFYFLNRYKMKDKFVYQNFYTYVKQAQTDKWKLAVEPVSSTSITILSISYISMENVYENFFVKQYTYGTQAGLAAGSGSRSHTVSYNFSQQFVGRSLSSNSSMNKLIVSWVGFFHAISGSTVCDIYINSYFSNTSFYSITISTQATGADWWNRTNVMACIINMEKFSSTVRLLSGTVVISPSNPIISWTDFDRFANISYCFGYSGINTNTNESQDMYWQEYNITAIKAQLSFLNYARYSYIMLWNQTAATDPVNPISPNNTNNNTTNNSSNNTIAPVDPIDPNPSPNPNNTSNNTGIVSQLDSRQESSNSPIGIIIGVVVGVVVITAILLFLFFKYKQRKGHRVPIPENQKDFHIFTPSFV